MTALSILDLVRITEETDARGALDNARDLAAHAETWGYGRFWVAEHHNMAGVASAATAVVVGHIAAGARGTIRVGAGGIMLPNHAPMVIAEQFGTLARLFPEPHRPRPRPGARHRPAHRGSALRRDPSQPRSNFPQDVLELQAFLQPTEPNQAGPGRAGRRAPTMPLWILGTSTFGAQLAADARPALRLRLAFRPGTRCCRRWRIVSRPLQASAQLERPHAMVGVNIVAADTDRRGQAIWPPRPSRCPSPTSAPRRPRPAAGRRSTTSTPTGRPPRGPRPAPMLGALHRRFTRTTVRGGPRRARRTRPAPTS